MDGGRKEESKSLPVLAGEGTDTVSHPEGRKRTCGNDSGVKEMIPFVGWEANKRWIGHLRVPIRHENESKSTDRGFGPFVPLPLACRAVRRQKSSNRETFLNKRGEEAGDAFILPVARPESERERGQRRCIRRRRNLAPFAVSGASPEILTFGRNSPDIFVLVVFHTFSHESMP